MSFGELLQLLERDADIELRAISTASDREVLEICAASAARCRDRLAAATRAFADEERAIVDRRLAERERGRRRDVLVARAAMLDRIREAVRAALPARLDPALATRLRVAAAAYGEGTVREVATGVVVELPDGTQVVSTLEALLDRMWPQLATEAVQLVDTEGS